MPTAAKPPYSLSSPQQVNQPTVKHASHGTCLSGQKMSIETTVLTLNKRGRGEEIMSKEKMRMSTLMCLTGHTACKAKKLFKKDGLPKRLQNKKSEPRA